MPLDEGPLITLLRWLGRAFFFVLDALYWYDVWGVVQLILGVTGMLTAWAATWGQSGWTPDEPRSQILGGVVVTVAGCLIYWSLL